MSQGKNELNEPHPSYTGAKKISFSESFEEAEQEQIAYWAGLSPSERFSHYYELMNRFYSSTKPNWSGTMIIIDV